MPLIQRDAPYPHWEFSDANSGDLLRLVPERGGLISGWRCGDRELVYLDLERFLDPAQSVRGGFPVLFPITGGLPNNQLPLPQGNFTLAQHGFARQLPWQMEALADGRGVALQLSDTPETLQAYPFEFLLRMEVRLAPGALEISTTVSNRSDAPMPFSFGLHPYFNLSSLEGVRFEGLPEECLNHLTMAPAATAEQMQQLASGIDLLVRPTGPVRLVDEAAGSTLELQLSHPFDLVVLWTEPPRPMVCIEPWSGPRQALLSGDRKIELAPSASTTLNTRYALLPQGNATA
ncbi:MAG: galactose mutarotase [Cyanobacteria bacterium]|nr:galactose mutarotase [Cyanobacteriota bacterium]